LWSLSSGAVAAEDEVEVVTKAILWLQNWGAHKIGLAGVVHDFVKESKFDLLFELCL
jgi:hypothetical protein